jgi:endoglucanase
VSGSAIVHDGKPFIPYGVTTFGLAGNNWQSNVASDVARIRAIASFWHGNTVRIQVAPPIFLAGPPGYVAALREEVAAALAAGLNVIVSAQYQLVGPLHGPDATTEAFWRAVAPMFRGEPRVWFDLFNEPTEDSWAIWKDGGDGYVGMQNLVDIVRAIAPTNLIVAEGLRGGETLQGVQGYLLQGGGIVYSVHPYLGPGFNTPTAWDANWGQLSSVLPILVGEWGEYDASEVECDTDAPTLVPEFLDYVRAHNIGLIAWALVPGVMIRGYDLTDPTAFDPGVPYTCTGDGNPGPGAQGPGRDLLDLFAGLPG